MALGIELAVDSAWTSGVAPLVMAVVGCIAAGLLVLFGTLAFVHVAVKVDEECLEVRCGHIGLPRRRIPLSQVAGADFAPCVTPRQWGGWGYRWRPEKGTAVVVRRGEGVVLRLVGRPHVHDHRGQRGGSRDASSAPGCSPKASGAAALTPLVPAGLRRPAVVEIRRPDAVLLVRQRAGPSPVPPGGPRPPSPS